MPVPADRILMGQAFSEITISHEDRIARVNVILVAAKNLYAAIDEEIAAETAAEAVPAYVDPTWDDFRGNGVDTAADGINNPVQDRGAELYDAIAALP